MWRFFLLILYAFTFVDGNSIQNFKVAKKKKKIYSCMERNQDQIFIIVTNRKVSSRNAWELHVRYSLMLLPQFQTLLLLCLILLFVMLNLLVYFMTLKGFIFKSCISFMILNVYRCILTPAKYLKIKLFAKIILTL